MPHVRVVPFVGTAVALSLSLQSAALAQPGAATPPLPPVPWEWFRVDVATAALTSLESKKVQKEKRRGYLYCYLEGASSPVTFRQDEPLAFAYRRDGSPSDIERVRKGQLRTPDQILHDVNTYHLEFLSVSDLGRRYGTGKFVPMSGEPYGEPVSGVNPKKQKDIGQSFLFKPSRPLAPGEYALVFGSVLWAPSYADPYCNYSDVSAFRIVEGLATAPRAAPPSTRSEVDLEQQRKAAEEGSPSAQADLGNLYFAGKGVLQDYVEAHKWLNLGCAGLSGDAQKQCVVDRDRVAALMTPAQIAEAQKLAREWSKVTAPGRR